MLCALVFLSLSTYFDLCEDIETDWNDDDDDDVDEGDGCQNKEASIKTS